MPASVLYLSFDGLTDPLGRSQILPYLVGLAGRGHRIRIVSLEKAALFDKGNRGVEEICREAGLSWHPFPYRTGPPILSAMLNLRTLRRASERLFDAQRSDILHCRSYPPAVIGLSLKRRSGCPLIFDMRGFWPDSRREGGRWRPDRMLGRFLFRRWKKHEAELIAEADHIVTLTNAARLAVEGWDSYHGAPISVVPCCADFDLFRPSSDEERARMRRELGFGDSDPILVYLGSIGTVYRLRDHLRLFAAVRRRNAAVKMLFVGRATIEEIEAEARQIGIALEPSEVRQLTAERDQVARLVSVGDVGTNFYSPTFSSLGVSPTKLGEYLACGVPAIANAHVGDVQAILEATAGGHVLPNFSDDEIEKAADAFFRLREMDRYELRSRARAFLDLPNGVKAYRRIYDDLSTPVGADSP